MWIACDGGGVGVLDYWRGIDAICAWGVFGEEKSGIVDLRLTIADF
jgi:hypothetical protein